jgi:hypothetical protein
VLDDLGSNVGSVPGADFSAIKRQVREADRSPPSIGEVKNGGAIPPVSYVP